MEADTITRPADVSDVTPATPPTMTNETSNTEGRDMNRNDTATDTTTTETVWVFRPGFGWVERPATS